MSTRLLIVDDEAAQCAALQQILAREGFAVELATSGREALLRCEREDFAVVLTDVNLGVDELSGLALAERIHEARPDLPIVVITGLSSLEVAIAAVRAGVCDFLCKPIDSLSLVEAVRRALRRRQLHEELHRLREGPLESSFLSQIGQSPAMQKVADLIERLRGSDPSVLVCGESGTGKEVVARALHATSSRAEGPLVAVNCAAIPPSLLESELFGHARGAFTDAKTARAGLFVQANSGTLVLDEISEMPLDMQSKRLRALQERVVRPVGANTELPFDARLISVTNRELETEVQAGRFRQDLYYRINVVTIRLPPLRERSEDVLALAEFFLRRFAARQGRPALHLSKGAAERLLAYDWPGNVRELENCIERAVAMARFDQITVEDLHDRVRSYRVDPLMEAVDQVGEVLTLDEVERRYIGRVMRLVKGNKTKAAQLLGLDRRTLYRKLERAGD